MVYSLRSLLAMFLLLVCLAVSSVACLRATTTWVVQSRSMLYTRAELWNTLAAPEFDLSNEEQIRRLVRRLEQEGRGGKNWENEYAQLSLAEKARVDERYLALTSFWLRDLLAGYEAAKKVSRGTREQYVADMGDRVRSWRPPALGISGDATGIAGFSEWGRVLLYVETATRDWSADDHARLRAFWSEVQDSVIASRLQGVFP